MAGKLRTLPGKVGKLSCRASTYSDHFCPVSLNIPLGFLSGLSETRRRLVSLVSDEYVVSHARA